MRNCVGGEMAKLKIVNFHTSRDCARRKWIFLLKIYAFVDGFSNQNQQRRARERRKEFFPIFQRLRASGKCSMEKSSSFHLHSRCLTFLIYFQVNFPVRFSICLTNENNNKNPCVIQNKKQFFAVHKCPMSIGETTTRKEGIIKIN